MSKPEEEADRILAQQKEIEKFKIDLAIYEGIIEGKQIIINQLEEEIRILKEKL